MLLTFLCKILFILFVFDRNFDHNKLWNFLKSYTTRNNNILCQDSFTDQRILHHDFINFYYISFNATHSTRLFCLKFYFISCCMSKISYLLSDRYILDILDFKLYLFITNFLGNDLFDFALLKIRWYCGLLILTQITNNNFLIMLNFMFVDFNVDLGYYNNRNFIAWTSTIVNTSKPEINGSNIILNVPFLTSSFFYLVIKNELWESNLSPL